MSGSDGFYLNGIYWRIKYVEPKNTMLVDRTGLLRVATTDPMSRCIYISSNLHGDFLLRVLTHEIGHCALVSFGLLDDIQRLVLPAYQREAEELMCNFIADYGLLIFRAVYQVAGSEAWKYIPYEIERFIA